MISKTKILEDGKTLLDYNITNGDSVNIEITLDYLAYDRTTNF